MAETTEKAGEKKLSVTPTKTLSLKGRGVEQGVVRQSFSHGRTKAVVVEKVKSRAPGKDESGHRGAGGGNETPGDRQGRGLECGRNSCSGTGRSQAGRRPGAAEPDRGRAKGARACAQ